MGVTEWLLLGACVGIALILGFGPLLWGMITSEYDEPKPVGFEICYDGDENRYVLWELYRRQRFGAIRRRPLLPALRGTPLQLERAAWEEMRTKRARWEVLRTVSRPTRYYLKRRNRL